jgi:DNA-binding XRE family transcriptional regulator
VTKEEFREWRKGFGLTQDDVAKRFGVSRNTVQNWEGGASSMPAMLSDICAVWTERLEKERPELGPVILCYSDGPMFVNPYGPQRKLAMLQHESYPTNAAAVARVRLLWNKPDFHGPFILEKSGKFLWNQVELTRVVNGGDKGAPTIRNTLLRMAAYVAENPTAFARGPKVLGPAEVEDRTRRIQAVGEELAALAAQSETRVVQYPDYEPLLDRLHELGFYPTHRQVGDVAHAFQGEVVARAVQ